MKRILIGVMLFIIVFNIGYWIGIANTRKNYRMDITKIKGVTIDPKAFRQLLESEEGMVFTVPTITLDTDTQVSKGNVLIIRGASIEDSLIITESLILETVSE